MLIQDAIRAAVNHPSRKVEEVPRASYTDTTTRVQRKFTETSSELLVFKYIYDSNPKILRISYTVHVQVANQCTRWNNTVTSTDILSQTFIAYKENSSKY